MEISLSRDARRVRTDLLYSEIRRGTQVAQGRGLQNLHSWVRIPPAPPPFFLQINGLQLSSLSRNPQLGRLENNIAAGSLIAVGESLRARETGHSHRAGNQT